MENLDNVAVFLRIYECGSLSEAARQLERSLQAVSRSLIGLETELGVPLIRRTTRRCTPTEAGALFYDRVKPAYIQLREAKSEAANRRAVPAGVLRLGAAIQFAPTYLVPVVAGFMRQHPQIEVELSLSDSFVDLVDANLDLALRIGHLPDSELKARRLGAFRRIVYGAPSYLREHGCPKAPDDLKRHQCLVRTNSVSDAKWPFLVEGRTRSLAVSGRFRANSTAAVMQAVAQGLGLGFTPLWQVSEMIEKGAVLPVLIDYELPPVPVHAVWLDQRYLPAKTRQFIDFLEIQLRETLT